jgi:gliding motility-associated-like protein
MRYYSKFIIVIILIICFSINFVRASHLIGGDITYEFLERNNGNLKYRFTMKIYRDLYDPQMAQLDASVGIWIFRENASGFFVYGNNNDGETIQVPLLKKSVVASPNYPCLTPPSNIGVEEGIYVWETTLSESNFKYVITHQRCCRNATINNIFNPDKIGNSYTIEITPEAQKLNNSSPVFKNFPPILICGSEPIEFDYSALDKDGDNLIYSFCNPLIGGSDGAPIPVIPKSPPYNTVQFKTPFYTFDKPLGGTSALNINANTGFISGVPDELGQFVISICVSEYRNGKLLSKIARDFQFNVVSCKKNVVALIEADSISNKTFFTHTCGLTTTFNNKSYDRKEINSFYWEFSINNEKKRFDEWSPVVTFRDSGTYSGKLYLNQGTPCKDSAFINVNVSRGIKSNFNFKYDTCIAGSVSFESTLKTGNFPLKSFFWDFGDATKDSNRVKIEHRYERPGAEKVTLTGIDSYGCKGDTSINFNWQPAPAIIIVKPDKFGGCNPSNVFFNNSSYPLDSTYKIQWTFGDGASSKEISPQHLYTVPNSYNVKLQITSPIGCYKEANFKNLINIKPSPTAKFSWLQNKITNLKPNVDFEDESIDAISWRWSFGDGKISTDQNPEYKYRDTGFFKVRLTVKNQYYCSDTIEKMLRVIPEVTFYMPNAFTPNDDAINEEFKGKGFTVGMNNFNMSIWNRWGELLFNTNNVDSGWNGLKNNTGSPAPEGVYIYEVSYKNPDGNLQRIKGYVTLTR